MKKQNKNINAPQENEKLNGKRLIKFIVVCLGLSVFFYAFAADIITMIATQTATQGGSNNGHVTFSTGGSLGETDYVEKGGNSSIIGNYLQGYYYDSSMGFFQLNWSGDQSKNVSFISSTSKCGDSYGFKLGGYANSPYFGFIQFNYDDNIFVYYCEGDKRLHGRGYNKYTGFHNFEGIGFEIFPGTGATLTNSSSNLFVNDSTTLDKKTAYSGANSNYGNTGIGGDIFNVDDTQESVIYIIR